MIRYFNAAGFTRVGGLTINSSLKDKILFYGRMIDVLNGQMPNLYGTDYITVSGDPGSETFQCPDSGSYLSADLSERLWFDPFDIRNTVTAASLVGYDFTRTFIKYDNDTPYQVREIIILKSDSILSSIEVDFLHKYMSLHWYWSGVFNPKGVLKTNRGAAQIPWFKYGDELLQYTTGLVTPLTESHLLKLYTLVKTIKTGLGISRLQDFADVFYVIAGETEESSFRNLISNNYHLYRPTGYETAIWTQYEGIHGDNTMYSRVDSDFIPENHAMNYTLESAGMSVYVRQNPQNQSIWSSGGAGPSTAGRAFILSIANNYVYGCIHNNAGPASPFSTPGLITATRIGTSCKLYSNSVVKASTTTDSIELAKYRMVFLKGQVFNNSSQVAMGYMGRAVTLEEDIIIRNAFEEYMDSYGKGVIA